MPFKILTEQMNLVMDTYGTPLRYYQGRLCSCVAENGGSFDPKCKCNQGYYYKNAVEIYGTKTKGANARLIVIHKDDDTTKSIKLFGKFLSFDKKTDSLKDKFFSLFKSKQFPLQGRLSFQGMDIAIENRKGSVRKGTDEDGEKWKTKMFYPYGYIRGTMGVDGDAVDCYIGDNRDSTKVFIVHQKNPFTGKFDEDKVMLGFDTKNQARDAYLAHYDSYEFLGEITEMDINEFKNKVYLTKKTA